MPEYPVTVGVEYSDRLSRLTTFFRYILIIPQYIVLWALSIAACVVAFIAWWAILFTGRYPRWAFDYISGYLRFGTRFAGYFYLLTDKYPPSSFS